MISSEINIIVCQNNYFIVPTFGCVATCPSETYEYSLNKSCLMSCPNNYGIDKEKKKCILKIYNEKTIDEFKINILNDNITSFVNSSSIINGSDFLAVILSSDEMNPEAQIKKGISAIDLGNCTQIIKQYYNIPYNESLIILNIETKNERNKNMSDDISLNLGKKTQIEIFDRSGRKLNLSLCNQNIKIMKYIDDIDKKKFDILLAENLANKGIDIFNPKDSFFNDICKQIDNIKGKDMILIDRRTDIFQNITFCQSGCTYAGMNYDLMFANCLCDSYSLEIEENNEDEENNKNYNEKINFNSIKKHILSNLFDFNINVMKCYNLVFNLKILRHNIGFYCMCIMSISQCIFLVVFFSKKLKPLKYFMLLFNQSTSKNPIISFPHKLIKYSTHNIFPYSKENSLDINKNKKIKKNNKKRIKKKYIGSKFKNNIKDYIIQENEKNDDNTKRKININKNEKTENEYNKENILINKNFPLLKKTQNNEISNLKHELFYIENLRPKININNQISNIYIQEKISKKENKNKTKEREENYSKIIEKNKLLINTNEYNKKNNNNKNSKKNNHFLKTTMEEKEDKNTIKFNKYFIKLPLGDEDLQNMDYEKAIIEDKRSFLRMFWEFLVDKLIILGTFFTNNYLNLFIIKLSFFIFTFQISFFLNALFYTDEYISDSYHNNGVLDFISGLPKSFYSSISTLIITNLLQMLSNSRSELMQVIRTLSNSINYVIIIDNKLRKLSNKLIAYFILVFSLGLFFLYYVTSFCATYRHSQKYWFIGCVESFAIDFSISFACCLILTLLRYICIRKKIKFLYKLVNIMDKLI